MPAPPLSNSFDGGTDGSVLTTGNTGGASGDAASSITDPNSIQKFTTTQYAHGGMAMVITQTATGASTRWDWTGLGSITTSVWSRHYLYLPALPSTNFIFQGIRTSAAALSSEILIDSTGKIQVHNAAGSNIAAAASTATVPANQWFRFEFRIVSSTTVGEVEWWLYNTMDSSTADDTKAATGQVLGANTDQIRWGHVTNPIASFTSYHDDVGVSSSGPLGPVVPPSAPAVKANTSNFPKFMLVGL